MEKPDDEKNPHAAALAALGAAKGGRARAEKLSPLERREQARQAARARWSQEPTKPLPKAEWGSPDRPLVIDNIEIPAYVLEDGRRVLTQRGLQGGIGMSTSGGSSGAHRMARFVSGLAAKGIETKDLAARMERPILFRPPGFAKPAYGYEATILADICDAVLEARRNDFLLPQQEHFAKQCEILVRGFARVGIIALVDEATGYQDVRAKNALAEILERFIAKELRKWVRTFPADFYKELYRLRRWKFSDDKRARPALVGHLTNNVVYARLAPGVKDELHRLTPRDEKGRLKSHLHRRLTDDIGHPKLREHLAAVVALMKASEDWDGFMRSIERALPKFGSTLHLRYD